MSYDLSGLTSVYSDISSLKTDEFASEKLQSKLKDADSTSSTDDQLMDACKQFESYFMEQVFKEMEKTIPETEYTSQATSSMVDYAKQNWIQQIAKESTESNPVGLAQTLYEQMKRKQDSVQATSDVAQETTKA